MLEIGLKKALSVREERLSPQQDACRLAYVSDIHLRHGRSKRLCQQVVEAVRDCDPDTILLGGDLVDSVSELSELTSLIQRLSSMAPVLAIGGNHDMQVGLTKVSEAVLDGGGEWIHTAVARWMHGSRMISVSGPAAGPAVADNSAGDDGDVRILCAHNPRIWKISRHRGYDLVLAGHLHGCQWVAFEYRDRLYPGALFYPYCYLNHRCGPSRLVVSRGVSDLVPIRWRCPREIVLCYI